MNRLTRADRTWLLGGAVAVVAMLAAGWFVFIGPRLAEASTLAAQARADRAQVSVLARRTALLQQQYRNLPQYQAQLDTDRQALPTTPATSDLLRALQVLSDRTGAVIGGVTVSDPASIVGNAKAMALPIVVTAGGTNAQLSAFIDQLQQSQRAVLVKMVSITAGAKADTYIVSLNLNAFVATGSGG